MLPTTALDDSDESSLNDSDTRSDDNVKARACMTTPKKIHMDIFNNADGSKLFETSSNFDASQEN